MSVMEGTEHCVGGGVGVGGGRVGGGARNGTDPKAPPGMSMQPAYIYS